MRISYLLLLCSLLLSIAFEAAAGKDREKPVHLRYLALADSTFPADTSLHFAKAAYNYSLKAEDHQAMVGSLILMSKFYRFKTKPDSASVKIEQGLAIADSLNDPYMKAGLLQEKGKVLKMKKASEEALESLLNSHNLYSFINDSVGMASIQVDLAEFYRSLGRYDDANNHIYRAFAIQKAHPLPEKVLISLYSRTAAIKNETRMLDSALMFSSLALEMSTKAKDKHMQAVSLNELGFLYENKGSPKAETYYKKAIALWDEMDNELYKCNAVVNLARFYYKRKNISVSIDLAHQVIPVAEKNDWALVLIPAYNQLALSYKAIGDLPKALSYTEKYYEIKLEQSRIDHSHDYQDVKNRYELEKKNRELREKEGEISDSKLAYEVKSREKRNLAIGSVLLLGLCGVLLYLVYQRRKDNLKLQHLLDEKEVLFRELHHRVKNNFAVLSGLLNMQEAHTQNPGAARALQECQSRIKAMSIIHQDLYLNTKLTEVNFDTYLAQLIPMLERGVLPGEKHVDIKVDCGNIKLNVEKAMPLALIVHELVTNVFKYGVTGVDNPVMSITMKSIGNHCTLEIYDNGPGLPQGLTMENAKTLGLKLTAMLAEQIDAKIEYSYKDGAHFFIRFDC